MSPKQAKAASEYSAKQITVLEGLEAVRRRPGMYIGSTGERGLHHLVWEVVDNSIDEAMAGFCTEITARLLPDHRVEVADNGRGIPVDIHKQYKVSALELVLTKLHAGGKFGGGGYKVSGGLHGVGVSVVNALSAYVKATVYRDGKEWEQEYTRGKPKKKVRAVGRAKGIGTVILFEPDPEIFETRVFNWETVVDHLRQQAYLTKGVRINLIDERSAAERAEDKTAVSLNGGDHPVRYSFYFEGGVASYVKSINQNKERKHDTVFYVDKIAEDVRVEVALQYTEEYTETLFAFANNIHNPDGGTHVAGFRSALTRALNNYARNKSILKEKDDNLNGDDVREGLTAIISVKVKDPQFEGQTKAKLGNTEVRSAVDAVLYEGLAIFLEEHPREAEGIVGKCLLSAKARAAAKVARESVLRKGALEGFTLPGKLADCSSKDATESELFLVEGDSAGGCFSGDTRVALLDGRNLSFAELVREHEQGSKHYCYTIKDDCSVGVAEIQHPRMTKKNATVIKIIFDNDEEIVCTPDHQFLLRDGSYKEAKDLIPSDSLMPLYRKISKKGGKITIDGYEMVFQPQKHFYQFTHLLSDEYNLAHGSYVMTDGSHRHHKDFNKRNNNPDNLVRLTREEHMAHHARMVEKTLRRPDVQEKIKQLHATPEFRAKIRAVMTQPAMRAILSKRAKRQWENEEYKQYMVEKFLTFYHSNPTYRIHNNALLNAMQKNYWSDTTNVQKQSNRVRAFFAKHPEYRVALSTIAKTQWQNQNLLTWRRQKTQEQWTPEFRAKRKIAYNQTYLRKGLDTLKKIYEECGAINEDAYNQIRKERGDRSIMRIATLCERFFGGNRAHLEQAVINYNHKIKAIVPLTERIDVYDIEVPGTHNFALASDVFVHNSAKSGRNRENQAILPLRGKILNVERARLDRIIGNNELKSLIIALGTNIGEMFDIEKLRYHRVVIMTDADVDGAHIRTLLLTFFYRHFPDLITKGHIYIAQPPLYRIQHGKEAQYVYNDEAKEAAIEDLQKKYGGKKIKEAAPAEGEPAATEEEEAEAQALKIGGVKVNIQRYKGLGEMNPEQLWETTMDPARRMMKVVTIEDAAKADEIFDILMGSEVAPRKKFIHTHAKRVQNLDI